MNYWTAICLELDTMTSSNYRLLFLSIEQNVDSLNHRTDKYRLRDSLYFVSSTPGHIWSSYVAQVLSLLCKTLWKLTSLIYQQTKSATFRHTFSQFSYLAPWSERKKRRKRFWTFEKFQSQFLWSFGSKINDMKSGKHFVWLMKHEVATMTSLRFW